MAAGNGDGEKQILVVTSDLGLFPILEFLLIADGWVVVVKTGIKNVVNSLEKTRPDLILLDLHVSTGDAVETHCAIRELNPHLPVLLLAESDFLHLAEQLATNGTRHILERPLDYEHLRNHLQLTLPHSTKIKSSQVTEEHSAFVS